MLLIDFSLFFYRMYHGAPYLTTSKCVASGFEFMILKNLQNLHPTTKALLWHTKQNASVVG